MNSVYLWGSHGGELGFYFNAGITKKVRGLILADIIDRTQMKVITATSRMPGRQQWLRIRWHEFY